VVGDQHSETRTRHKGLQPRFACRQRCRTNQLGAAPPRKWASSHFESCQQCGGARPRARGLAARVARRLASDDADHLSCLVADCEAQTLAIMASGCMTIVVAKAIFNCVDVTRRVGRAGVLFEGSSRASIVVMPP
jgi:hypothetical protein